MKEKSLKELDICDDFIFGLVMSDEGLCKEFIEVLLNVKLAKIVYKELQKVEKEYYQMRGIRLDAYVESDGTIFEVEMQNGRYGNLVLRVRYYQAMIDTTNLEVGKGYEDLKDVVILFVCKDDPFKIGLPIYTIRRFCKECPSLDVDNGTREVYVNASAYEKASDPRVRELLQYIFTKETTGDFSSKLDNFVEYKKANEEVNKLYLSTVLFRKQAIKEGVAQGIKQGIKQGIAQQKELDDKIISQKAAEIAQLKALLKEKGIDSTTL